ncbi:tyrosine-type recombinase/integrase [Actinomadura sp. 3N508]|uniref:tyrosine-type recombinase/integrase n=1 Tax=Actinomadura sp. 3N508 TaxID=3375153 RepID=UPI00378BB225
MALAVVHNLASPRRLVTGQDAEDFEQELVDQFALAVAASGATDGYVSSERGVIFEFRKFLCRPVWMTGSEDADRYLAHLRKDRGQARQTVEKKAGTLARFFNFLVARYQGDIHALTGCVLIQPIDEFNRPAKAEYGTPRIPPPEDEVTALFEAWRDSLPAERKYLPAARDYVAASLWRRVGLRIGETVMLDIRDWRPDLGEHGKIHVRFGKGSRGRGPKPRLVPAINSADALLTWWLTDVRHQFGEDWSDPDAPMFPSERRDPHTGRPRRAGDDALRSGLAEAVERWLPSWKGRLTPHGMRHFCASSLYSRGLNLKAIQDILGHSWLSTTTQYIHVHDGHIERAWASANDRVAARLSAER